MLAGEKARDESFRFQKMFLLLFVFGFLFANATVLFSDANIVIKEIDIMSRCHSYKTAKRFDSDIVREKVYKRERIASLRLWKPSAQIRVLSVGEMLKVMKDYKVGFYREVKLSVMKPNERKKKGRVQEYEAYYSEGALYNTLANAVYDSLLQPEAVMMDLFRRKTVYKIESSEKLRVRLQLTNEQIDAFLIESASLTRNRFEEFKRYAQGFKLAENETEEHVIQTGTLIDPLDSTNFHFYAKAIYSYFYDVNYMKDYVRNEITDDAMPGLRLHFVSIKGHEVFTKFLVPPFHFFQAFQQMAIKRDTRNGSLNTQYFEKPGFFVDITNDQRHFVVMLFDDLNVRTKKNFVIELPKVIGSGSKEQKVFTAIANAQTKNFNLVTRNELLTQVINPKSEDQLGQL